MKRQTRGRAARLFGGAHAMTADESPLEGEPPGRPSGLLAAGRLAAATDCKCDVMGTNYDVTNDVIRSP